MHLNIAWVNPSPHPECGYKAIYRKNADDVYNTFLTSGSTSGSTTIAVPVLYPACFEGNVYSDCCLDSLSTGTPFGVNAYSPFFLSVAMQVSPLKYLMTITSTFANPYDTLITGTFTSSLAGTVSYTATYVAGSIHAVVTLSNTPSSANEVISNIQVSAIAPVFDNGGTLQQLDTVSTPDYFQFYYTSGTTTWNGSPTVLPSFLLNSFSATIQAPDFTVLAGDLLVSWIQQYPYAGGASPYDTVTFKVYDSDNALLGTAASYTSTNGLINATITLTKAAVPLVTTNLFTIKTYWSDNTLINTKTFYLPG